MFQRTNIELYTDGAASTKTNCGGWACVLVDDNNIIDSFSGGERDTTNNRMELTGFLEALNQIELTSCSTAKIYCDSAYVVNCFKDKWYEKWMRNRWRTSDKQPVKNRDLWEKILDMYFELSKTCHIEIIKVQSHADNHFNNYADLLAVKCRKSLEEGAEA